jgi:putative tricarboxylic transport membrane protein
VTIDRVAGAVLTLLALFVVWESRRLPLGTLRTPGPAYTPVLLAALLALFGLVLFAFGGRAPRLAEAGWQEWRHVVAIFGVCTFAALALERIGYRLTVAIMLLAILRLVEQKATVVALAFAIVVAQASFFLFGSVLRVPLPRGPFGL